jgi:transitional endoplasmic reticulum ATPase
MKTSQFETTSAIVFLGLAAALFAVPIARPIAYGLFGLLLLIAACVAYWWYSPSAACLLLGFMTSIAAFAASRIATSSMEFRTLLAAAGALLVGAVVCLFLKSKVRVLTMAGPPAEPAPKKLTTGEHMRQYFAEKKAALPAPRFTTPTFEKDFQSIVGMDEFKKKLLAAGKECIGPEDVNGIMLYGEPGNGKTVFAKALAGELGMEFIEIQRKMSKWVGQETEQFFNQLHEAISRGPCVVFMDEVDSLLSSRDDTSNAAHSNESNAMVNRLLSDLVRYRKHSVVFVAATNFIDKIDPAARRPGRFDFVLEVPNPDLAARRGLLLQGISRHASGLTVDANVIESLAKRWNGFNVATILGVTAQIPQYVKGKQLVSLGFDDFMAIHRLQQGIANRVAEDTKSFAEMTYPEDQSKAIHNLMARMEQSFEIEEAGGAAPSGVLFYGGPGTGKTETARMLAKETKWAFFPVAGPDIARDPSVLEKLLKKVKNARPAIIFIDEADDLLADRMGNPNKASTNKLLEAMDGANGRVNDLLWLASTNYPDNLDAAVMRPGRFTEKIEFHKPEDKSLLLFAKAFFAEPKRNAVMQASWDQVAAVLQGCSIAEANGILMQAWNLTLTANGGVDRSNPVTLENLNKARGMVQFN